MAEGRQGGEVKQETERKRYEHPVIKQLSSEDEKHSTEDRVNNTVIMSYVTHMVTGGYYTSRGEQSTAYRIVKSLLYI